MINNIDFLNIYLGKSNLIEASAGTGKTNILSLLYLRFLLNINIENKFSNLFINNILIVTFTDLACLEIKKRILNNLRKLRICFIKNIFLNDYIKHIFLYIKNIPNILDILIQYENNIDISSIYTIHSFCKKILFSYFINSNINNSLKILDYEYNLIYKMIIFFWRKYFYKLSYNLSKIIFFYWSTPEKLYNFILPILNFIDFKFNNIKKYNSIEDCYNKIIFFINKFKKEWIENYNNIYVFFINLNNYYNLFNNKIINNWFNIINLWCNSKTINFYIPYCLKKFKYKYIIKYKLFINLDIKYIFIKIEKLYIKINNLYNFVIFKCLKYIKDNLNCYKKENNFISFNDLISKLNNILSVNNYNNSFIKIIRKNYPLSLIDEFQDTDFLQYNIFYNIYIKNKFDNTKIIFIGDPKQSIYTFRGANIFSYIKSKNNIDFLYILNINWRSSFFLVKSINFLFNKINNPFIFKDTNYLSILPSYKNKNLIIKNKNKIFNSMNFYILNNLNNLNYKNKIAKFCSIKLYKILNSNNIYIYKNNKNKRKILPSDICILVRKNYEIKIFFNTLKKFFLPINCILNKSNVFDSLEAKEIYFLLKAVIFPNSKLNIRNALSTNLFNYNLNDINKIINHNNLYIKIIDDFYYYYNILNKYGIYCLLNFFIKNKNINNFLNYKNEQYNLNILHISEILEKKFYYINDKLLLLIWLNNKINNSSNNNNKEYYLRSFSYENNGIKISTIHKSKGLQYNIVWIPFLFYSNNNINFNIYHNRKNCKTNIDFLGIKKYNNLMNEEIISEEMRLLYVSITRSVYMCNIILYENFNKKLKFCFSSIGRIIGNNKNFNFSEINNKIFSFNKCKYINFNFINIINYIKKNNFYIIKYLLDDNYINNKKKIIFNKIINYSKIILLNKNNKLLINNYNNNNLNKNIFFINLPKGKNVGLFFHKILEKIKFNKNINNNFLLKYMYIFDIKKKYFFNIKKILFNILNVILYPLNINLINININFLLKEFDFFLNIKKFNFSKYNIIINKYDKISCLCDNLSIKKYIKGYLNGVIDLIFLYKKKYYIVDYKSNWFGNNILYYNKTNIIKNIIFKRYDIQYQIYSIALHNYLNLFIKNYDYSLNFGGIYYIFMRGLFIENNYRSYNGILFIKPNKKLIFKLNDLLKK